MGSNAIMGLRSAKVALEDVRFSSSSAVRIFCAAVL